MIKPQKQSLSQSCLVANLLMLLNHTYKIPFTEKDEEEILIKGMNRKHSLNVVGVPQEFYNKYKKRLTIIVDNKYFTDVLIKAFNNKKAFSKRT